MIRPHTKEDLAAIVAMVQEGRVAMSEEEIIERATKYNTLVLDDDGIRGVAVWDDKSDTPRGGRTNVWLFTALADRGRGVASSLWEEVWPKINAQTPQLVVTGYRSDQGNSAAFFEKRGFTYWFSSHVMKYSGPKFNTPTTLTPIAYDDSLFSHYINLTNDGFLGLRRENDIVPHECYPPDFNEGAERKRLLEDRENIYLFRDNNDVIVAMSHVENHCIDIITVANEHMRKGYGREITKFCVDMLKERGFEEVTLGVVDTNQGARKLYESLGFELMESVAVARRTVNQKS